MLLKRYGVCCCLCHYIIVCGIIHWYITGISLVYYLYSGEVFIKEIPPFEKHKFPILQEIYVFQMGNSFLKNRVGKSILTSTEMLFQCFGV